MVATKARTRRQGSRKGQGRPTFQLIEEIVRSAKLQVDAEESIIRGVKILGTESSNGRRYTKQALVEAQERYEGITVNVNHPAGEPDSQRDSQDALGQLTNIQLREDGLYGDLVLLKSHPMAERLLEAATRMPRLFGLSHNAAGEGRTEADGTFVVEHLTEVRSVDVVTNPATTKGLLESRQGRRTMQIKQLFESLIPKLEKAKGQRLKNLLEMGELHQQMDDMGQEEVEAPAEDMSADDQASEAFVSMAIAVLRDESLDKAGKLKKLRDILSAEEKLMGGETSTETSEQDDGEGDGEDKKKHEAMESKIRQLERKDRARDLCEAAGVVPSKALLKALCSLESEKDCKDLIEEHKETHRYERPRSGPPRNVIESKDGRGNPIKKDESVDDFVNGICV